MRRFTAVAADKSTNHHVLSRPVGEVIAVLANRNHVALGNQVAVDVSSQPYPDVNVTDAEEIQSVGLWRTVNYCETEKHRERAGKAVELELTVLT